MIKMVEDVGAPALVTVVDLVTLEVAPAWNEYASYIMTGIGYIGAIAGFGGTFVKNIGVAALPLAAHNLRDRIKGVTRVGASASRLALRPVSSAVNQPIRRAYQPEFNQAGAHAF